MAQIYEDTAAMLYAFRVPDPSQETTAEIHRLFQKIYELEETKEEYWEEKTDEFREASREYWTESEAKQYLIEAAGNRLQDHGVSVRTGFISPEQVTRRDVNPVEHINQQILNQIIH